MTLKEALQSIIRSYGTLMQSANGASVSFEEKVSTGKSETRPPRDFGSEADELAERVKRLARLSEAQMVGALRSTLAGSPRGPLKKATRTVILEERGKDSAELAFLYGIRQDSVERIRREAGVQPKDGEPLATKPLTEPTRETLRRGVGA